MKDEASLISDLDKSFLGKDNSKVRIVRNKEERRRLGVIDKKFAFEFVSVFSGGEYMGYLASNDRSKGKEKREMDMYYKLKIGIILLFEIF